MTSKTVYPNIYNSTTGGKFQPFKNLSNVHSKKTSTYANTELIHGKKEPLNRPGTVTVSNFKCGLPTGSLVTKVTVVYAHSKVAYNGKVCNIPAPEISLMNDTKVIKYNKTGKATTKTGKAPTTNIVEGKVSFSSGWDWSLFNSNKFGVRINYPTNANNEEGYMRLYYVYVILEYKQPNYSLKCTGSEGNTGYNGDDYTVQLDLSNLNGTRYATSVVLTAPAGFTYQGDTYQAGNGHGSFEKVQNQVYRWTPKMIGGTMSIALKFSVNVTIPSGGSYSGTFTAIEQLLGKQSPHTAIITPKPRAQTIDEETSTETDKQEDDMNDPVPYQVVTMEKQYVGVIELELPEQYILAPPQVVYLTSNKDGLDVLTKGSYDDYTSEEPYESNDVYTTLIENTQIQLSDSILKITDGKMYILVGCSEYKVFELHITIPDPGWGGEDIYDNTFIIKTKAPVLTTPNITVLTLGNEELNRLGQGIPYILQSNLKLTTTLDYVLDWGHDNRIGVFNNAIPENVSVTTITPEDPNEDPYDIITDSTDYDNLTVEEIFNGAEYWSNPLTNVNEYENLECSFVYNENYPLYILITGDYPESPTYNTNTVKFIEPCIIEDSYYDGRESNGTYPVPIENTKNGDGDFAELNINSLGTASPVIYYDLPFDEDYETNDQIAIRGIEVSGVIEQNTDDINIYAKLRSPTGESRTRSLNLDALDTNVNSDNRFVLGGMGDLWGLSTLDIVNLEDWEIEFLADNTVNSETGTINYRDISLTVYISEIDSQNITCKVENEDISYYGAFLTALEIPEGLNTAIKYIDIDGTDTHYPYQQNINPKEITLELDVGDCDLTSNTLTLRDITRLFTTKRDKYNRPIPKRIEFSHYPDMFWEYLMEDSFDNPIEILSYPKVKIKLTVPSGTAYKKTATSSNRVGYVNGLVNVNPVIVIKPTANLITISETLTDQNFHMGYNGDLTDKVIVIDCEDRIAWLKTDEDDEDGENISYAVDINSDWFSIIEEYQFETDGCVIKDISYIERW